MDARRYVDWEIQASLRQGQYTTPNGLSGIKLSDSYSYPSRLNMNLKGPDQDDCYARVISYPTRKDTLERYIDDAFNARTTRNNLIINPQDRFHYNRTCD